MVRVPPINFLLNALVSNGITLDIVQRSDAHKLALYAFNALNEKDQSGATQALKLFGRHLEALVTSSPHDKGIFWSVYNRWIESLYTEPLPDESMPPTPKRKVVSVEDSSGSWPKTWMRALRNFGQSIRTPINLAKLGLGLLLFGVVIWGVSHYKTGSNDQNKNDQTVPIDVPQVAKRPTKVAEGDPSQRIVSKVVSTAISNNNLPTMRQFYDAGVLGKGSLADIEKATGLPIDQPIAMMDKVVFRRLIHTAYALNNATDQLDKLAPQSLLPPKNEVGRNGDLGNEFEDALRYWSSESGYDLFGPSSVLGEIMSTLTVHQRAALTYSDLNNALAKSKGDSTTSERLAEIRLNLRTIETSDRAKQTFVLKSFSAAAFERGYQVQVQGADWVPLEANRGKHEPALFERHSWWALPIVILLLSAATWWFIIGQRRSWLDRSRDQTTQILSLNAKFDASFNPLKNQMDAISRGLLGTCGFQGKLNMKATVRATSRAGGFFTPIIYLAKKQIETVILFDQRSNADHLAERALAWIEALKRENLPVHVFRFTSTPHFLLPMDDGPAIQLAQLASTFEGARLFIIGDAGEIVGPGLKLDKELRLALSMFGEKSLFDGNKDSRWTGEVEILRQYGGVDTHIFCPGGILAALKSEAPEGKFETTNPKTNQQIWEFPESLSQNRVDWLSIHVPNQSSISMLFFELRAWLGPGGMRLLSAVAVYPILDFRLTSILAAELSKIDPDFGVDDDHVLRVSALPWFRYGFMPDWLREKLIDALNQKDRECVLTTLNGLLNSIGDSNLSNVNFRFAADDNKQKHEAALLNSTLDQPLVDFVNQVPRGTNQTAIAASKRLTQLLGRTVWSKLKDPVTYFIAGIGIGLCAYLSVVFGGTKNYGHVEPLWWAPIGIGLLIFVALALLHRIFKRLSKFLGNKLPQGHAL